MQIRDAATDFSRNVGGRRIGIRNEDAVIQAEALRFRAFVTVSPSGARGAGLALVLVSALAAARRRCGSQGEGAGTGTGTLGARDGIGSTRSIPELARKDAGAERGAFGGIADVEGPAAALPAGGAGVGTGGRGRRGGRANALARMPLIGDADLSGRAGAAAGVVVRIISAPFDIRFVIIRIAVDAAGIRGVVGFTIAVVILAVRALDGPAAGGGESICPAAAIPLPPAGDADTALSLWAGAAAGHCRQIQAAGTSAARAAPGAGARAAAALLREA